MPGHVGGATGVATCSRLQTTPFDHVTALEERVPSRPARLACVDEVIVPLISQSCVCALSVVPEWLRVIFSSSGSCDTPLHAHNIQGEQRTRLGRWRMNKTVFEPRTYVVDAVPREGGGVAREDEEDSDSEGLSSHRAYRAAGTRTTSDPLANSHPNKPRVLPSARVEVLTPLNNFRRGRPAT